VELNDWILALHLLSAFALVGAMTLFSILIVALWRCDSPTQVAALMRPAQLGNVLVIIGTLGTIVFGVWLAISLDAYQVWDGWVIAAIVLWAGAVELGRRAGTAYADAGKRAEELTAAGVTSSPELAVTFGKSNALWFHFGGIALILLILVDMIWKPGA
jgi:hypothetical protein